MDASDWICYLLYSYDNNRTYIGSTKNLENRLNQHNSTNASRKGAKKTRGSIWIPLFYISGFINKNQCLSFEATWKNLHRKRNNNRFFYLNHNGAAYSYTSNALTNRVLDLLYYLNNFTLIDNKFKYDCNVDYPIIIPDSITINTMLDDTICNFDWPYFVNVICE
jgi:predicted GIY-YIG superfamily endonuclease